MFSLRNVPACLYIDGPCRFGHDSVALLLDAEALGGENGDEKVHSRGLQREG